MNSTPPDLTQQYSGRSCMAIRQRARVFVLTCATIVAFAIQSNCPAEEVKIWEFSPYETEIWYSFDASVSLSSVGKREYLKQLDADLQRTFRAAWRTSFSELAPELVGLVHQNFDEFTVEELTRNELVLVTSIKNEYAKTLRTFEATIETLSEIAISETDFQKLQTQSQRIDLTAYPSTAALVSKCKVDQGGIESIKEHLLSASIAAALIPRTQLQEVMSEVRAMITTLPWQSESIFRQRDKLFFITISQDGDEFEFKVRELDCPMQYIGPAFTGRCRTWPLASRVTSNLLTKAFAPIARVEDAEAKSAQLRLRAGGLILLPQNPAAVVAGDIMQPIVRRDDRNGIPTLLEPLSFTFAAITGSDGVKMDANVYTYSGGPGLQGRKNRRTRRVLLRVRPNRTESDIRVTVRGKAGQAQAGCFIYERDLLNNEFNYLGRTDWRGQFTIPVPNSFGAVLPEEIRKARDLAKREQVAKQAAEQAQAENSAAQEVGDTQAVAAVANESDKEVDQMASDENADSVDSDAITLNYGLLQVYVKSGDTVLAKLPMVPGLKDVEVAELPDDTRRLQAEAFVRGFQGKILDLIGLRNLLAARVNLYVNEAAKAEDAAQRTAELAKAEKSLEELRQLRNYNEMADELEQIQREMLDEKFGDVSASSKNRIDRMFQMTRDMLQKYLQDDLLGKAANSLKNAK